MGPCRSWTRRQRAGEAEAQIVVVIRRVVVVVAVRRTTVVRVVVPTPAAVDPVRTRGRPFFRDLVFLLAQIIQDTLEAKPPRRAVCRRNRRRKPLLADDPRLPLRLFYGNRVTGSHESASLQPPRSGKDSQPEKRHTLGNRRDSRRLRLKLQSPLMFQPLFNPCRNPPALILCVSENQQIVHIAQTPPADAPLAHNAMVKRIQISIGEPLARQVADRQSHALLKIRQRFANDPLDELFHLGFSEHRQQDTKQPIMRNRIKVMAHVKLQEVCVSPRQLSRLQTRTMRALALPAGIAAVNEAPLKKRRNHRTKRMVDDAITNRRTADDTRLRIPHLELPEPTWAIRSRNQLAAQCFKIGFKIPLVGKHLLR